MKVVILAGGRGTRLAEETSTRPKPMVEVGGHPLLWHIMQTYAHHGFREFVVACGYMGSYIKQYFRELYVRENDFTVDLGDGSVTLLSQSRLDWKVDLIDTGLDTQTGGRVRRLRERIGDAPFMLTYGDGVGAVDIGELVGFHRAHGRIGTVTAVRPPARFGGLALDSDHQVREFSEKPQTGEGWINGGFFVFEPAIFDYLKDDTTILERDPLERLAAAGELMAYRHAGFWQPVDTLREKLLLEQLWATGTPPWRPWEAGTDDASL